MGGCSQRPGTPSVPSVRQPCGCWSLLLSSPCIGPLEKLPVALSTENRPTAMSQIPGSSERGLGGLCLTVNPGPTLWSPCALPSAAL